MGIQECASIKRQERELSAPGIISNHIENNVLIISLRSHFRPEIESPQNDILVHGPQICLYASISPSVNFNIIRSFVLMNIELSENFLKWRPLDPFRLFSHISTVRIKWYVWFCLCRC